MKIKSAIYTTLFAGLILALLYNCKKDEPTVPVLEKTLSEIIFNSDLNYGTMTDQDGNTYKTIVIGTQIWMAENLSTIHYRNGDLMPNITGGKAWIELNTGAYCNYNNDAKYSLIYGRLFNLYAILDSRNIAPPGWHVPSYGDWLTMLLFLDPQYVVNCGLSNEAGLKLKETGWTHWYPMGEQGTNETGFTAIPGGIREPYSNGSSWFLPGFGTWWNSDSGPMGMSSIISDMRGGTCTPYTGRNYKSGYSVRLVKD